MSAVNRAAVEAVLRQYTDPYLNQDPVSAGCVRAIEVQGDQVTVQLELGYAAGLFKSGWAQMLQMAIEGLDGVRSAKVDIQCVIAAHKAQAQIPGLANVKNVVAVASGKGGVGKSTTAANLALALAREGARVGILDADIYGPSQGVMFGIAEGSRPKIKDQKWFVPIQAHGVEVMSMAFLTDDNTPMVWRGPMVSGALMQLVMQTDWGNLDYLVIDMPPGTGDIQLTLAQKVPVAGAVIVTTPRTWRCWMRAKAWRCSARSTSRCWVSWRTWRYTSAPTAAMPSICSVKAAAKSSPPNMTLSCWLRCRWRWAFVSRQMVASRRSPPNPMGRSPWSIRNWPVM